MPELRILAVDASLTSTGLAYATGTAQLDPGDRKGLDRLRYHRDQVLHFTDYPTFIDLAVIEDMVPSPGKYSGEQAALGWILRVALADNWIPYADIHPAWVKTYAVGKGGGKGTDKRDLAVAAFEYARQKFDTDDECDAWWMYAMAWHHYTGRPICEVPRSHWRALDKVTWPDLRRRRDADAWAVVDDLVATGETEEDARRFAGIGAPHKGDFVNRQGADDG